MITDKLIAEFMERPYIHKYGFKNQMGYEYDLKNGLKEWWSEDALQYHILWEWLMPVVKKINDAPGLSIAATVKKTELVMEVWNAVHVVDIEAAHKAAVRFIEWYNQQEKNLKPFNRDWEINPDSELFKLEKDNVGTGGNWIT